MHFELAVSARVVARSTEFDPSVLPASTVEGWGYTVRPAVKPSRTFTDGIDGVTRWKSIGFIDYGKGGKLLLPRPDATLLDLRAVYILAHRHRDLRRHRGLIQRAMYVLKDGTKRLALSRQLGDDEGLSVAAMFELWEQELEGISAQVIESRGWR